MWCHILPKASTCRKTSKFTTKAVSHGPESHGREHFTGQPDTDTEGWNNIRFWKRHRRLFGGSSKFPNHIWKPMFTYQASPLHSCQILRPTCEFYTYLRRWHILSHHTMQDRWTAWWSPRGTYHGRLGKYSIFILYGMHCMESFSV